MTTIEHLPVMSSEVMEALAVEPGGLYVDATLGLGGHTELLLKRGARVLSLDRDADSIAVARKRLESYEADGQLRIRQSDYRRILSVLASEEKGPVAGIIADLGVSTYQLTSPERGFSIRSDGPLDMRMDRSQEGRTAAELVNEASFGELLHILRVYGEERDAKRIVRAIERRRVEKKFETTQDLAATIVAAKPHPRGKRKAHGHPATLTFQALRIAVNDELAGLGQFVEDCVSALKLGGRFVVIAFHSLEDRPVKQALQSLAKGCICLPELVGCACGKTPQVRLLSRKVIRPTEAEAESNPSARSARLRAAEKITASIAPELETAA